MEKEMAAHSRILAWKIPWTEELGGLQFMALQRVRHDFVPAHTHTHTQTHTQSLQEQKHRKHRDPGAVLTHQAHGACGNSPESQLSSVAGHTGGHWDS